LATKEGYAACSLYPCFIHNFRLYLGEAGAVPIRPAPGASGGSPCCRLLPGDPAALLRAPAAELRTVAAVVVPDMPRYTSGTVVVASNVPSFLAGPPAGSGGRRPDSCRLRRPM